MGWPSPVLLGCLLVAGIGFWRAENLPADAPDPDAVPKTTVPPAAVVIRQGDYRITVEPLRRVIWAHGNRVLFRRTINSWDLDGPRTRVPTYTTWYDVQTIGRTPPREVFFERDSREYDVAAVLEDGAVMLAYSHGRRMLWIQPDGMQRHELLPIGGDRAIVAWPDAVVLQTAESLVFVPIRDAEFFPDERFQLADRASHMFLPLRRSGDRIVWTGSIEGRTRLYVYDLAKNAQSEIMLPERLRRVVGFDGRFAVIEVDVDRAAVVDILHGERIRETSIVRPLAVREGFCYALKREGRALNPGHDVIADDLTAPDEAVRFVARWPIRPQSLKRVRLGVPGAPGPAAERLGGERESDPQIVAADDAMYAWDGEEWHSIKWLER